MDYIKIAICDDEKNIRAYLASLVRKQGREYDKTEVTLTGGISLPLSKRYEDFAAAYLQFVQ